LNVWLIYYPRYKLAKTQASFLQYLLSLASNVLLVNLLIAMLTLGCSRHYREMSSFSNHPANRKMAPLETKLNSSSRDPFSTFMIYGGIYSNNFKAGFCMFLSPILSAA